MDNGLVASFFFLVLPASFYALTYYGIYLHKERVKALK
jgi:hypothetical protein